MGGSPSRPAPTFVGSADQLCSHVDHLIHNGGVRLTVVVRRREVLTMAATIALAPGLDDLQLAAGFVRLVEYGLTTFPESEQARALRHLMALSPVSYGQSLSVRRGLAARALGVKVDTFRRNYEPPLLKELAARIWLIELGTRQRREA
jgi:hypothetical protein